MYKWSFLTGTQVFKHALLWHSHQLKVCVSLRFNRRTDPALEQHIDEVWTERVSKEPWLFNAAKFRLHSFCLASPKHPHSTHSSHDLSYDCAEDQDRERGVRVTNRCLNQTEDAASSKCDCKKNITSDIPSHSSGSLLTLRLGLTCYKDYLGTNWSRSVAELRQRGEAEFNDPLALLAQPLGVGAVLCTHDGQVVFIRRSQKVAEAGGLLDIPGGHPEPKVTKYS